MRNKVLLVYPLQGFSGVFVKHTPISLLYASAELVKRGIEVEILDNRLYPTTWREELRRRIDRYTLAVGVSVMSGRPIINAIEIGRLVKELDPEIKVIWGGPHVTFCPETILDEESCDFAVAGYGSSTLNKLVEALLTGASFSPIKGLSFRQGRERVINPEEKAFEKLSYRDIPYHLIPDYRPYGQLDQKKIIFSMYSVLGCPYKCSFCSSPAQYKGIPGKVWVPLEIEEVVGHIEHVVKNYGADYIYFIDDDSFVNLAHVEGITDEIRRRRLGVKLGFRGARINEIKKMSHQYLDKLAEAGTDILHIGAESGSDRILRLIKKNCTVADIMECNRKLATHPQITVGYNFMVGIPSETMPEVRATRDLMLALVEDHPRALIFQPNRYRPLPGTELFDLSVREWGYRPPSTLAEWAKIETEGEYSFPWYPKGMKAFCDLLLISSYFMDGKIHKVTEGRTLFYRLLRLISRLYAPIARFRLAHDLVHCLVEYKLYRLIVRFASSWRVASGAGGAR